MSTGERAPSRSDIPKLVPTKLDYSNWNAWKIEIVRALRLQQVAHYIGMDGGNYKRYQDLQFKRPDPPLEPPRPTVAPNVDGEMEIATIDPEYAVRYQRYKVSLAAFEDAQKLRNYRYHMDGVSVSMAIAATCGSQISLRIGQVFGNDAELQPKDLWKFLESTTKAVLLPARERLLTEMQNMRQGADESLEIYIARIQKLESDLSMVSDNSDGVRSSVTMKLLTSVNDAYTMAATMVKTVLNSTFLKSDEEERWSFVVTSLREEEQRQIEAMSRAAVEQGYASMHANRQRQIGFGRGGTTSPTQASTSGRQDAAVRLCWNCDSETHYKWDCPQPPRGRRGGRFGRGGRSGSSGRGSRNGGSAMASTTSTLDSLVGVVEQLSAALRDLQSGSHNAMNAQARGAYIKLMTMLLDSGCSRHMSPNKEMFSEYRELRVHGLVKFGGGSVAHSIGIGTLMIKRPDGTVLYLKDALYVPKLVVTLISVAQLTKSEGKVLFEGDGANVYRGSENKHVLSATLSTDSVYIIDVCTSSANAMFAQPAETAELWHRRMGHRNYRSLAHMQRLGLLHGCRLTPAAFLQAGATPCEACIKAKTHREAHTTAAEKSTVLLHRIIVDMKGPLVTSTCGCKYVVTVTDQASGNCAVGPIKNKSDAAKFVISVIVLWERQVQAPGFHKVQRLRSDNGTEFMGELFEYMLANGIQRELGAPYTPEQVGGAERQNRTQVEPTRAMLADANLSQTLWPYAIRCACILTNSSVSEGQSKSPHELFYGTQAPTRDLRVFGCDAWVMLPKPKLTALGSRVRAKGIFVGYPMPLGTRQYLVLIDGVVIRSSDVQFHESPASVAPSVAHRRVSAGVPTPDTLQTTSIFQDSDFEIYTELLDAPHVDIEVVPVQLQVDDTTAVQNIHIVPAEHVEWPVQRVPVQNSQVLVPIQIDAPLEPVQLHVQPVQQQVVQPQLVEEQVIQPEQHHAHPPVLPQTHAGRSRRNRDPDWRAAHIPGYDPALSATIDTNSVSISAFPKHRKPGWGTSRGAHARLAAHIASHRYGMQRPDLAWTPGLSSVPEIGPDMHDAFVAFPDCPRSHSVCPTLSHQRTEMDTAMRAAVSSPRNFPRPGLVYNVNQDGIPACLRTNVSCMPREDPPRVLGDMSVMPRTIEEALARPDHAKWREALEIELGAMKNMKVWQVAQLPAGATAVGCRMLFDIKQPSGRYKCRLVAQGFSQVFGEDYSETYAPVAAMQTLRVFWSTCAHFGLSIRQLDVSTAFLHAPLEEQVYMKQLKGLRTGSASEIWELFKAVYGLKQAPRAWNKLLSSKLEDAGWVQSDADPSLYLQYNDDGEVVAAALIYVDDLQLASKIPGFVDALVEEIKGWWPCTVQAADRFLGIEIEHDLDAGLLSVHQATYIDNMVVRYECADEFDTLLPLPPTVNFVRDGDSMGESLPTGNLYSSLVGSLNHLSQCTRPDISYAVGVLSRYLKAPCAAHWGAAVYLLRYVKGTRTKKLVYGTKSGISIYADASYRRGPDARSTTGYVVMLHGAAVAWGSKLQAYAALSTTEAEVQAAVSAGRLAIWMGYILPELGQPINEPMIIFGDNQAALSLLAEKRHTRMSQHMEPIDSRLRHWVKTKRMKFAYVSTQANWADCLTKALPRPALVKCCEAMGLHG